MTPTTTRELAEALRDAREFIGEAIQCRGNVDLCNCNDHLLLRRLDDAQDTQQSQSGEREAVPVFWVIERNDLEHRPMYYYMNPGMARNNHTGMEHAWTKDIHKALKFSTRDEAIQERGNAPSLQIVEHAWITVAPPSPPNAEQQDEGYPGIAHDFETTKTQLRAAQHFFAV